MHASYCTLHLRTATCDCCCRIQAAQAAAAPATNPHTASNPIDAQPPLSEEPPPLPPLPPEEEAQPPPPPADPPCAPTVPLLPAAQTSSQSAWGTRPPSQQSRWQQPGHVSSQPFALQQPSSNTIQPGQRPCSSGLEGNGTGSSFNAIQIKTEDVPAAGFETVSAAIKMEAVGTTGRTAQMSSSSQQGRQSGGAIQFGFGGTGKPAGKVSVYWHLVNCHCKNVASLTLMSVIDQLLMTPQQVLQCKHVHCEQVLYFVSGLLI